MTNRVPTRRVGRSRHSLPLRDELPVQFQPLRRDRFDRSDGSGIAVPVARVFPDLGFRERHRFGFARDLRERDRTGQRVLARGRIELCERTEPHPPLRLDPEQVPQQLHRVAGPNGPVPGRSLGQGHRPGE